jgi:hypothetical protein
MKRFGIAGALVALALCLSGCAEMQEKFQVFKQTWETAKAITLNKTAVVAAVSTFRAAERTATVYVRQKHCPVGVQRPTCMSPAIREQLVPYIQQGDAAANALLDFWEAHPNELGSEGVYDAVNQATAALKKIFATYKIGDAP